MEPEETAVLTAAEPGPDVEHLKMIQAVIARLAGNSFLVKGWMITLTAGLTVLARSGTHRGFAWLAVGAAALFALMDASYLARERAYRRLYDEVRKKRDPFFGMATTTSTRHLLLALASRTVGPLYLVAAIGALLVALTG